MAIVRTGSVSTFEFSENAHSTAVTVPADAEFCFVGVTGYDLGPTASYFSSGTLTLGGQAMTAIAGDGNSGMFMGAVFYKTLPLTGSQTLAWDWAGTSNAGNGVMFLVAFYKGLDTASPIRSQDAGQQAANPHATGTLTALSGDLIVAWMWQFASADSTITWTGATEVQAVTPTLNADGSLAEASPTGNQTVSASGSDNQDGGIVAIVLTPAGGGGGGAKKRMLAGLLAQRALRV